MTKPKTKKASNTTSKKNVKVAGSKKREEIIENKESKVNSNQNVLLDFIINYDPKKSSNKTKSTALLDRSEEQPTIIKKRFERIELIKHPFTEPHEKSNNVTTNKVSISEISGVGESMRLKFQEEGINTLEDFVNAGILKISKLLGWSEKGTKPFYLRGLSLYENRIIKIKSPKTISQFPLYIDIETDPGQRYIWMIGIFISRTKEFIQLVADKPKDHSLIIRQCYDILSDFKNETVVSYSGSRFDERLLSKRFEQEKLKSSHIMFEDILLDLKASLALPIKEYTLGAVGEFYGYNFKHPNMDGIEVARLYLKHAKDLKKYKGYKKLCEYNEDDVRSLVGIVENIYFS